MNIGNRWVCGRELCAISALKAGFVVAWAFWVNDEASHKVISNTTGAVVTTTKRIGPQR